MKYLIILVFLFASTPAFCQSKLPHIEWSKSYGGLDEDDAFSMSQTSDKGFIIAGESHSSDGDVTGHHDLNNDNADFWIVKIDSAGTLEWEQSYGGDSDDIATAIKQTSDNGYIVTGFTNSNNGQVSGNHGGGDIWVLKLDSAGGFIWKKCIGGSRSDGAIGLDLTSDNGYIIAGSTNSLDGDIKGKHDSSYDYLVVKLDHSGNILWEKTYGGSADESAFSIHETSDHGFITGGSTSSNDGNVSGNHGSADYWIVKTDSIGNIQWQKCYGGSDYDKCLSVNPTKDNGYILSGYTESSDGEVTRRHYQIANPDYWIVKLDSTGNVQWEKTYGGSNDDIAQSAEQTFDGGFIIAGYSSSNDYDVTVNHGGTDNTNDYWIVKLDSAGNLQWQKTLGGSSDEFAYSVIQTSDSGFIVTGLADSDDGDITDHHFHEDYWIVKLGYASKNDVAANTLPMRSVNYPNPFNSETQIELPRISEEPTSLVIFDLLGREVKRTPIPAGETTISFSRNGLSSGVYIYHIMRNTAILSAGRMTIE